MIAETPSEAKGKGVKAELPTLSTNCCQLSMKPGENMSCMLFELENFEDAKFFAQTLEVGKNDRNYDMMYGVYVDICESALQAHGGKPFDYEWGDAISSSGSEALRIYKDGSVKFSWKAHIGKREIDF